MTDGVFVFSELEACLPERFLGEICELVSCGKLDASEVTELRLRAGGVSCVTVMGRNVPLKVKLSRREIDGSARAFCKGSMYAHADTVRLGYIGFGEGVRIGVCGSLAADGRGVREITSLNIRLPHIIRGVCDPILRRCLTASAMASALIYSPPGIGKTTLLRDIAVRLGGEFGRRVAVIDSRNEIYIEKLFCGTMCDMLIGYPRGAGIEIATRVLSPEVLITDELGDAEEARQILSAVSAGVPIIATAHGSSVAELTARPNLRMLMEAGVFDFYIGVSRHTVDGRLGRSFVFDFVESGAVVC